MPSSKNIEQLEVIKEKLNRATAVFFVDYQGLTHQTLEEFRRTLSDIDGEIAVLKNTLFNIALKEKDIDASEKLNGPHAMVFAYGDAAAVAKALMNFYKQYELPVIKFGVFENAIIEDDKVKAIADLPSREVLLSMLASALQSPMQKLVYDLKYPITGLAISLEQIKDKKPNTKTTDYR